MELSSLLYSDPISRDDRVVRYGSKPLLTRNAANNDEVPGGSCGGSDNEFMSAEISEAVLDAEVPISHSTCYSFMLPAEFVL